MYISIQYLRALAAFMVLLSHVAHKVRQSGGDSLDWFQIGGYGVDLFFIISGFIMCLTVDKKKISFATFMKARVIRIIPLYWLLTSFALMIYLIKPSLINSSGGVTSIVDSYLLLPLGDKFLINNGWTLSFEFFFYIIFASFIFLGDLQKLTTSIVLVCLAAIGFFLQFESALLNFMTDSILIEFVMGIASYSLIKKNKIPKNWSFILIICGVMSLSYGNVYGYGEVLLSFGRFFYAGIPMMMLFIGFVSLESKMKMSLPLYNLGMSSYAMYLLHPFILSGVTLVFKKANFIVNTNIYIVSMIFISLVLSFYCYKHIELELDRYCKKVFY